MKVELLYPEITGLYGECGDRMFLEQLFADEEVIRTQLTERPRFLDDEDVKLVFIGPSSESDQSKIIRRLMPLRDEVKQALERGVYVIATGNALEIFGDRIIADDGSVQNGLGITDTVTKTDLLKRYSGLFLGIFEESGRKPIEIIGFKTQFTMSKAKRTAGLFRKIRGVGLNPGAPEEGIRYRNLFGTYLLGPFLIMNPLFVRYLLDVLGLPQKEIPYEKALMAAYENRLAEFKDEKTHHDG